MKRFLVLFILPIFGYISAQPMEIPQNLAQLINVPFFVNSTVQNSMNYQFDKKIKVEATGADGKKYDLFIYINTSNGNVGSFSGKPGSLGSGEINPDNEKFRFTIQQPIGIINTFYNTKIKKELVHRYTTLNSEIHPMEMGQLHTTIEKTGVEKRVLPQDFSAGEFADPGRNLRTFLCGAINHNQLSISKFIGFATIGYVKTNHGILMVVENTSADGHFKAVSWQNGNYVFNTEGFESSEAEFYEDARTSINNKIEKVTQKESNSESCRDLEEELKRVKLENLNKSKAGLDQSMSGNLYDNPAAIVGLAQMGDLKPAVMESIIDNELQICELEHDENMTDSKQRKLNCLLNKRPELNRVYMQMEAVEEEFEGQPAKIHQEKMKLLQDFSQLESCR